MKVLFKNESIELNSVIKVNDELSLFTVVDKEMNEIKSEDIKGVKLILTIPSVDTSVCSLELAKFVQYMKDKDVTLISVSMDLPFALNRWCQSNASENLIMTSDFRYRSFAKSSGLLMDKIGLFSRSVLLVDDNNKVVYREVVENVSNEPNYQKVMDELEKIH